MHPLLYSRLVRAWALATGLAAMVDTYQVMNCKKAVGDYAHIFPGTIPAHVNNLIMALPYGIVRGGLNNITLSLNMEGACGNATYTAKIADGLTKLFHHEVAGSIYRGNQALFGTLTGGPLGGIGAEAVYALSRLPVRVIQP